jgi:hypothetical protein
MWRTFSRGAGFQKLNSSTVPMHYSLLYICILQNDIFRKVSVIAMVLSLKTFFIHEHVQPHWSSGQSTDM